MMQLTYDVELKPREEDPVVSRTPTGQAKLCSRSRIQNTGQQFRVEVKPSVFKQLMVQLGPCQIDLFASRLTAQLKTYMSWRPDPGVVATDALSQSWNQIKGYAFPPFSLIGRCLTKVRREQVLEIVLITPKWPTQTWFPVLISMAVRRPIQIPVMQDQLTNHKGENNPLVSDLSWQKEFQKQLILASWRSSTEGAYSSCWNRWERWCAKRGFEAIHSPLNAILEFLTFEYL